MNRIVLRLWKALIPRFIRHQIALWRMKRMTEHLRKHARGSETSFCRTRLAPYCVGYGLDLGFGGDAINESAIRVDYPQPYTQVGQQMVQLGGDAASLYWFRDGVLDYVYSSHLLEDFVDVGAVLKEWWRVLCIGGRLIIYCPDQKAYEEFCRKQNELPNEHHVHAEFSLDFVKNVLPELGKYKILHEASLVEDYSWELVIEKI